VENSLCKVLVPGDVVVMDNASFHKSKKTIELIKSSGCEVLYSSQLKLSPENPESSGDERLLNPNVSVGTRIFLPPYSPDFNPIEKRWGTLKKRVRSVADAFEHLTDAVKMCLTKTSDEIRGLTGCHWPVFPVFVYKAQATASPMFFNTRSSMRGKSFLGVNKFW
jgi:transposase